MAKSIVLDVGERERVAKYLRDKPRVYRSDSPQETSIFSLYQSLVSGFESRVIYVRNYL